MTCYTRIDIAEVEGLQIPIGSLTIDEVRTHILGLATPIDGEHTTGFYQGPAFTRTYQVIACSLNSAANRQGRPTDWTAENVSARIDPKVLNPLYMAILKFHDIEIKLEESKSGEDSAAPVK